MSDGILQFSNNLMRYPSGYIGGRGNSALIRGFGRRVSSWEGRLKSGAPEGGSDAAVYTIFWGVGTLPAFDRVRWFSDAENPAT